MNAKRKLTIDGALCRTFALVVLVCLVITSPAPAQTSQTETQKLTASDGAAGHQFGWSVSTLDDCAIVGAPRDDNIAHGLGSAYVFERIDGIWTEVTKLTASDALFADYFGTGVSLSTDRAIVGAPGVDDNGFYSGAAYVFERIDGVWTEVAKLTASDGAARHQFGWDAVSISGDCAIVGARGYPNEGFTGSAYIFERIDGVWTEIAKLTASDGAAEDYFGGSVSVSGDTAIVGAAQLFFGDTSASGAAYVFERIDGVWTEVAKLTGSDATAQADFGRSVSILGNRVVVGAWFDGAQGSAYVFELINGIWTEVAKLTASDGALYDHFGTSVSLSANHIVVGASYDDDYGDISGSAYLFERIDGVWTEVAKLTANDGASGDRFGEAVALSGDHAIIAAMFDDDNGETSGSAYMFEFDVNQPPLAVAGDDQSIHAGDLVSLDGSASYDDNTPAGNLAYAWTLTGTPVGSTATLTGAETATPSFVADLPGTYVVSLVVTDAEGLSSYPDSVTISSANLAPTANAGPDTGAIVGGLTTLHGTGSSDPESDPLTYTWSITQWPDGSSATLSDAASGTPYFIPDVAGQYTVQLVVNDGFVDSAADEVVVSAIMPGDYAQNRIFEALELVNGLCSPKDESKGLCSPAQVTTHGNQTALGNFLTQAIAALQADPPEFDRAISKLSQAIARTDGCALRGGADGPGSGWDWITDCAAQESVYWLLSDALDAISP
jgi:hypothetical protein